MTADPSRRRVLTGAVGGLAALAGCSFSVGDTGSDRGGDLRRLADVERVERPYPHPLAVPDGMIAAHYERARTLLESVPESPDVENELIADRLADERERLAELLAPHTEPAGTATESAEATAAEPPDRRLVHARQHRQEAATLWGRYRAATGDVSERGVADRRDEQRDRLAAFRADWSYRASGPVRATLVHDHFEGLVDGIEHALAPWPQFPDDPAAGTEEVGYLVGKVEEAAATLDDLERYRRQVVGEDTDGYRPALMAAAMWLDRRARRRAYANERPLEDGRAAFDRDLGESVARYRFDLARETVREYDNGRLQELIRPEQYASGVLFATTRRAAVEAFAGAVEAVTSGPEDVDLSPRGIEEMQRRARESVGSALDRGPTGVMASALSPSFTALREARDELERGESGTPARAYAAYLYAERFAAAAVDAVDEVVFLLREAAD
ncbi:hypothetical protein [Haloarcula litorea]|uniref:hypothetical protein n=1 Tax=Haloarcula litorea TaxID=3032579 RepID=UPI0023E80196|nr:hypothetical protein [Halomicroarcula sp. GDY20]